MKVGPGEIEVSFDVKVTAGVGFNVNRAEWEAMSDEDKRKRIQDAIDKAAIMYSDDVTSVPDLEGGFVSMQIVGPEADELDLVKDLSIYDPEE